MKIIEWPPINQNPKSMFAIHKETGCFKTGWHSHPKHQLLYAENGILQVHTGNKRLILPARNGAWIPAHRSHKIYSNSPTLCLHTLYFHERQDDAPILLRFHIFPISTLAREMIIYTQTWPTEGVPEPVEQSFFESIRLLAPDWCNQTIPLILPTTNHIPLQQITDYIHNDLASPLQLNSVAMQFGLSGRTLLRLFKQELGMTFGSYLRVARIIRAIELLSDANTAVTDVAYSVGYRSLSSFSQTFQQLTGITPREYLKRFR